MPGSSSLPLDDQPSLWDAAHVLDLLQAPSRIRREEPWAGWIRRRGGLDPIYARLRDMRLRSTRACCAGTRGRMGRCAF